MGFESDGDNDNTHQLFDLYDEEEEPVAKNVSMTYRL